MKRNRDIDVVIAKIDALERKREKEDIERETVKGGEERERERKRNPIIA